MKTKEKIENLTRRVIQLEEHFGKMKSTIGEIELRQEAVEEFAEAPDDIPGDSLEMQLFPEGVNTIWYRYSFRDVTSLLRWSDLHSNAGPLFLTVLNGITGLAGMCYGVTHPKRSFIRLAMQDMGITELAMADLLYECKKSLSKVGLWAMGAAITTNPSESFKEGAIFYPREPFVYINVIELAQCYVKALNAAYETGKAGAHPVAMWPKKSAPETS